MTATADLVALLVADLTDSLARSALADRMEEAGRSVEARILRDGSRTSSGVVVTLTPRDFGGLPEVRATFAHANGPADVLLREWRASPKPHAWGVGTVAGKQTQVGLPIPKEDWDAAMRITGEIAAAKRTIREAAETPKSRARKDAEYALDRLAADMDRADSHN